MDGTVVGINTAIYSRSGGSLGIGFAIPSEMVQTVIAAEKTGAHSAGASRPWFGGAGEAVTQEAAESLGMTRPVGVLVSKIHKASPALKAGLKVGDVVTAVNGREIADPAELKFRLATVPLGEKADLTILRQGKSKTIEMEAMTAPDDPPRNDTLLDGTHLLNGATVANINPLVSVELGIETDREGVVVVDVDRTKQASRLVRPGDIIISVNDDRIEDIKDLRKELFQSHANGVFDMTVERDGRQNRIVIR
jgi:serine protease Do